MTPIKDVTGLPKSLSETGEKKPVKRVREAKSDATAKPTSTRSTAKVKDQVEISTLARQLSNHQNDLSRLLERLEQVATTDREKLAAIQQRLESEGYSKPEVSDKIVESLLGFSAFSKTVNRDSQKTAEGRSKTKFTDERLEEVRNKIENGKYDSEEVMEEIITGLLDYFRRP